MGAEIGWLLKGILKREWRRRFCDRVGCFLRGWLEIFCRDSGRARGEETDFLRLLERGVRFCCGGAYEGENQRGRT